MYSQARDQTHSRRLLFDGDDTLWRSNDVFEGVYKQFEVTLHKLGQDPADTLRVFRINEERRVAKLGTGHTVFLGTLQSTCAELGGPALLSRIAPHLSEYALIFNSLGSHLYEDTIAALQRLSSSSRLALVTRGNSAEQNAKIALSGLQPYFEKIYVVPDKTPDVYQEVLSDLHWPPSSTWMVGNSLRHDIHPALTVGLGTIHVDRGPGWVLEHAERPPPTDRCLTVSCLSEVADVFERATHVQTTDDST